MSMANVDLYSYRAGERQAKADWADHDKSKEPAEWFWLVGYLAGKALAAAIGGDTTKARHHTISAGAALLNWHASTKGEVSGE